MRCCLDCLISVSNKRKEALVRKRKQTKNSYIMFQNVSSQQQVQDKQEQVMQILLCLHAIVSYLHFTQILGSLLLY